TVHEGSGKNLPSRGTGLPKTRGPHFRCFRRGVIGDTNAHTVRACAWCSLVAGSCASPYPSVHCVHRRRVSTLMESWPRRHRITVDEYYRMAEVGLLAPDARVELIDGEIIDMAPISSEHGSVVDQLAYLLM